MMNRSRTPRAPCTRLPCTALLACTLLECALLAGCAFGGGGSLDESAPGVMRGGAPSPAAAQATVRPGASAKADVQAALGRANVVVFDSGWEVWVYRWPGADRSTDAATELVLLFDRSGVVRKSRIRAAA
jgi:hypothetical protein